METSSLLDSVGKLPKMLPSRGLLFLFLAGSFRFNQIGKYFSDTMLLSQK